MKSLLLRNGVILLAVAALGGGVHAQNAAMQSQVRIGILAPQTSGGDAAFANRALEELIGAIGEVGFYSVLDPQSIEKTFESIGKKVPQHCADPRCILSVGTTLKADRMLAGTIDAGEKSFGADLVLLDVLSKQVIEQVQLESDPGVGLEDFIKAAVLRLHGQPDENLDIALKTYFGPAVHNELEWAISSGVCLGAGLIWAIANGGFTTTEASRSFDDDLTGLPSRAYLIPMHARPAALAHAYTAASTDAYGVFYNPAGMAWVEGREAVLTYQKRVTTDNVAAAYVNKATREIGFGQGFLYDGDRDGLYSEATFVSAFSYRFNRTLPFLRPFALGLNWKLVSTRYGGSTDETFDRYHSDNQEGQGFGMGFDIGARAEITRSITGGVVLKDVSSFVREKNRSGDYSYTEFSPLMLLTGGTIAVGHLTNLFAEIQVPVYKDQNWEMAGAIEQTFFRYIKARVGMRKEIQTIERTPWILTGGLGVQIPTTTLVGDRIAIDASYEFNQIAPLAHPVNFSLLFGF